MDNEKIFALDIGTRKIVGLLMEKEGDYYHVLAAQMIEHNTRAMLDGQIHDVEAVAATISTIKKSLETKLDLKLKKAAVAAAGRALKTTRGKAEKNRTVLNEISREEVRALEIEAVQQAQYLLAQEEMNNTDSSNYFCVGYSVNSYKLEGQAIGNLVSQVGQKISVEVIATFLPRVVVDSLFSALKLADLEVLSLTLEPIAALSIVIPPNMRLLNLALVDIGAGTSDIAIVRDGNIFAYAMVPVGGDELTEQIAREYLLDFNSAEELKCILLDNEELNFTDILGNEIEASTEEILSNIDPIINDLCAEIARNIIFLNEKKPDAVLCIGGGSLTPSLTDRLADTMEIQRRRVGISNKEKAGLIKNDFDFLNGPQGITPMGIAYNSFNNLPLPLIKIVLNKKEMALWNAGKVDVSQALLSSGINLNNIYGKAGMGKTVEINGFLRVIKGELGTAPIIKVNGREASLDTILNNNDEIEFFKGTDGEDACICLEDINSGAKGIVHINGKEIEIGPLLTINGERVEGNVEIPDRARIELKRANYLKDIMQMIGVSKDLLEEKVYNYYLNEQAMVLKWVPIRLTVDGKEMGINSDVDFGAHINYSIQNDTPKIKDVVNADPSNTSVNVQVNGQSINIKGSNCSIKRNGKPVSIDEELYEGVHLTINKDENPAILSDIFQVINIKPQSPGKLEIKVDGQEGGFTTPIHEGSVIELHWDIEK